MHLDLPLRLVQSGAPRILRSIEQPRPGLLLLLVACGLRHPSWPIQWLSPPAPAEPCLPAEYALLGLPPVLQLRICCFQQAFQTSTSRLLKLRQLRHSQHPKKPSSSWKQLTNAGAGGLEEPSLLF